MEGRQSESQQSVYSPVLSPNHKQNLITPTHSSNTPRLTPKKMDMELASQRHVLHKYPAERVKIVYHRKGQDEVSSPSGGKKSKAKKTPKSSSKARRGSVESQDASIIDHQHLEDTFTEQDSSILNESEIKNGPTADSVLAPNSHFNFTTENQAPVETVSLTSSVSTMTVSDKLEDELRLQILAKEEEVNQNTEMIDQLWDLIEQMNSEILKLNSRVDSLESIMLNEIQVLKAQRQKHLLSSKAIAEDMARMQNAVSNNGWKRIEEDIGHLLKRAKRANTGHISKTQKSLMDKIEDGAVIN